MPTPCTASAGAFPTCRSPTWSRRRRSASTDARARRWHTRSPWPRSTQPSSSNYNQGQEQARLETINRVEFIRTQEIIARHLPPPPARILDVGGGAGVHAVQLTTRGYEVTLVDPIPLHVDQARSLRVSDARLGDARALEFTDESFDAALLLGPLYHLIDRSERVTALREAARVARGGPVIVAAISRFASTIDGLVRGLLAESEFAGIVEADVASGVHSNPGRRPGWFTTPYFHRPDEVASEVRDAGLRMIELVAVEGPASVLTDESFWIEDPQRRETLLRAIRRVEHEPSLLGLSAHFLAVAR